jgi:DNA excision repair protein ERCC-4
MPRTPTTNEPPPLINPFSVIVDTREQAPYHFSGISGDKSGQTLVIPITNMALRSGDYSIAGFEDQIAIERKSHADFLGSIGRGRDRLRAEMERLSAMKYAAVVVEADWRTILDFPPTSSLVSPKVASRTMLSWSIRYGVHFWTCMNRRHGELVTFRLLERFWRIQEEQ